MQLGTGAPWLITHAEAAPEQPTVLMHGPSLSETDTSGWHTQSHRPSVGVDLARLSLGSCSIYIWETIRSLIEFSCLCFWSLGPSLPPPSRERQGACMYTCTHMCTHTQWWKETAKNVISLNIRSLASFSRVCNSPSGWRHTTQKTSVCTQITSEV